MGIDDGRAVRAAGIRSPEWARLTFEAASLIRVHAQ
jgi:hypothetical protein